jgi:hypothetical protein
MGGATGRPLYLEFFVKILTMTARYGTMLFFVNILRLAAPRALPGGKGG